MEMGLKSWNPGFERLGLGIKSYPKEWEWDLSPEFPKLKDCDWELTPILGNGNGT